MFPAPTFVKPRFPTQIGKAPTFVRRKFLGLAKFRPQSSNCIAAHLSSLPTTNTPHLSLRLLSAIIKMAKERTEKSGIILGLNKGHVSCTAHHHSKAQICSVDDDVYLSPPQPSSAAWFPFIN
jgi:hypothetical protein